MSHLEQSLQRDMDRISAKVREMARLAEAALNDGMAALAQGSRQLAYLVILRDQRIDELEKEIDRLCLEFIMRQQPVSRQLRFVYVVIKLNSEIERVGDYAESIARQVLALSTLDVAPPRERLLEMAGTAIPMFRDAVVAFLSQDPELARAAMEREEVVDRLRHRLSAELVQLRQEERIPLEALPPLQTIGNRLERVADQARSICQEVLYMCTGEYLKHIGSEVYRLLFVDRTNACASQMAEAIGSAMNNPKFVFSSAGLSPGSVDPATVQFLSEKGLDIAHQQSKSIDQVPNRDHYQIIVALAEEAQQVWPAPPTKMVCLDWSLPDPSARAGSPQERRDAYEWTYRFLEKHIRDLVNAILADQGGKEEQP